MTARAIWKGRLALGKQTVPVRMYAAVEERTIHFRLLHKTDLAPVEQRILRKHDGTEVPKSQRRKAYPIDAEHAVILDAKELEHLEPATSRDIVMCRFVTESALSQHWYERPYYLGPDGKNAEYFALAKAMAQDQVVGIARWSMRSRRYVGALHAVDGYLSLITLRRSDQIIAVTRSDIPKPDERELELAAQLIEHVAADFDPSAWKDQYRERVHELIRAKARGKAPKLKLVKRARPRGDLAAQLRQSLALAGEKKVA